MWSWFKPRNRTAPDNDLVTWGDIRAEMRAKLEDRLARWKAKMPIWESTIMAHLKRLGQDRPDALFACAAGDTIDVNAGCMPEDTQELRDYKIVGYLHRFHQQLRDPETGKYNREVSEAIGMYLYGYFVLHPVNDLDAPLDFANIMQALGGLQNVALCICFEAHECDPNRFMAAYELAVGAGLFSDRLLMDSDPMHAVFQRTVTSQKLFHRYFDRPRSSSPSGC